MLNRDQKAYFEAVRKKELEDLAAKTPIQEARLSEMIEKQKKKCLERVAQFYAKTGRIPQDVAEYDQEWSLRPKLDQLTTVDQWDPEFSGCTFKIACEYTNGLDGRIVAKYLNSRRDLKVVQQRVHWNDAGPAYQVSFTSLQ